MPDSLGVEIANSADSALSDASQNMSLVDRIVQGAMERFGPTAGIRALNELFSILPGTGRITGGIEGLLDLGDEWVGDLASRNLFSRAIDRLAPAERAGRGAIESVENRYSKIVDPIKMGMEWMRIMQNPLAEVAGMAFEGKPNAQRLVRSALTPPPPGMAQGGAVNYNNPLMMRRGGMTRRRRRRRGGVDSLMARRRRLSPAEARRQQRREEVIDREAGPMVPLGGAPGSPMTRSEVSRACLRRNIAAINVPESVNGNDAKSLLEKSCRAACPLLAYNRAAIGAAPVGRASRPRFLPATLLRPDRTRPRCGDQAIPKIA